jgi:hypothetical protein
MHRLQETLYRLFFTRDDDLDLLQLIFLGWIVFVAVVIAKVGAGTWELPTAGWSVIGSVFATLAIAGTPRWISELLAKRQDASMHMLGSMYDARYYPVDEPPGGV